MMRTFLPRQVLPALLTAFMAILWGCGGGSTSQPAVPAATAATVINRIAGGADHTLLVKSDGTLWSWGGNGSGQLGDADDPAGRAAPAAAPVMTGVVSVAAGDRHSLALKQDGTVWGFGDNSYGQAGGSGGAAPTATVTRPRPIGIEGVAAIAAGGNHSLALRRDGTVWAWGSNAAGELGNGSLPTQQGDPARVPGLSGVVSVAAADLHSLALLGDGTVWAWGDNSHGQLGTGVVEPGTHRAEPVRVAGLDGIVAISAAGNHSLALKGDGTLWAWGANSFGEIGNGATADSPQAAVVPLPAAATAFAAGGSHSVVVTADGAVRGWGGSPSWQIGAATAGMGSILPHTISGLADVAFIGAGKSHAVALRGDGTIVGWGENLSGQLGNGAREIPAAEEEPPPVTAADFVPSDGDVLNGTYTVAGRFFIPEGVTVRFTGYLEIEADSIDIRGWLRCDGNADLVLISQHSVRLDGGVATGGSTSVTAMASDAVVLGRIEAGAVSITTGAGIDSGTSLTISSETITQGTVAINETVVLPVGSAIVIGSQPVNIGSSLTISTSSLRSTLTR